MLDPEIECLKRMYAAFSDMPDDDARRRALWWLGERHKSDRLRRQREQRTFDSRAGQRWADDGAPVAVKH